MPHTVLRTRTAALALVALLAGDVVAQQPAAARDDVDRIVDAAMQRQHIPGVALAIVRRGRVIRAQGYGVADVERRTPVTTRTVFKIGSVSKQFLATGIMLLAQERRLSVDDPVSRYLDGTPQAWSGITLRHLLTHTSGILREGPAFDPARQVSDIDVVRSAYPAPLEFPIAAKWQYCNVCYFALAEVIHRVSGKPWSEYLADRVFRRTGMAATFTTDAVPARSPRARGYEWRDGAFAPPARDIVSLRPSGAFSSTVLDLARWDSTLYGGAVLSEATKRSMWTPVTLADGSRYPYGFGWSVDSLAGHRRVHHGGSLPGFRAHLARFPDDSLTVIVLTNGDGALPQQIADSVGLRYLRGGGR